MRNETAEDYYFRMYMNERRKREERERAEEESLRRLQNRIKEICVETRKIKIDIKR